MGFWELSYQKRGQPPPTHTAHTIPRRTRTFQRRLLPPQLALELLDLLAALGHRPVRRLLRLLQPVVGGCGGRVSVVGWVQMDCPVSPFDFLQHLTSNGQINQNKTVGRTDTHATIPPQHSHTRTQRYIPIGQVPPDVLDLLQIPPQLLHLFCWSSVLEFRVVLLVFVVGVGMAVVHTDRQ